MNDNGSEVEEDTTDFVRVFLVLPARHQSYMSDSVIMERNHQKGLPGLEAQPFSCVQA
jgi:hypothetical protein